MALKTKFETVTVSKSKTEDKKVPISKMTVKQCSEAENKYTKMLENNKEQIFEVIKAIRPQITVEELKAILYGAFVGKDGVTVLESESDVPEGVEFGKNTYRGVLGVIRLAELGIGLEKAELQGKTVPIAVENPLLKTELHSISERMYWILFCGLQLKKIAQRVSELEKKPKEFDLETTLDDLLNGQSDCSEKDEIK